MSAGIAQPTALSQAIRPPSLARLRVKIFADGADRQGILELSRDPLIGGFTTNPTLMRQAGITDYEAFAKELLTEVPRHPISFEVFSDDFNEMELQAARIASWGQNVYVKIPVTNTRGETAAPLIQRLVQQGVRLNVTAVFTTDQIREVAHAMAGCPHGYLSVFAGRIADTGVDPLPIVQHAVQEANAAGGIEVIWASPREVLNIFQADAIGCHVITVTHDLLRKLGGVGKDLAQFSLETVGMFYRDAVTARYSL
jgi:transaldolase